LAEHDYTYRPDLSAEQVRAIEAGNGFEQRDYAASIVEQFVVENRQVDFKPLLVRELQSIAVKDLVEDPGQFRTTAVRISKSKHMPPSHLDVPSLIDEMCSYVNDNWHEKTAYHLAAFVMWRQNWIHPFVDGNGRTSRELSYIVLSAKLRLELPGQPTIPEQIMADRTGYFGALESADKENSNVFVRDGVVMKVVDDEEVECEFELKEMENLLRGMLATQLLSVVHSGDGK